MIEARSPAAHAACLLDRDACPLRPCPSCSKLFPEWVKKHEMQQAAAAAAATQQAAAQQAAAQQPPVAAAGPAGGGAAVQQALLEQRVAGLQAPQWSNYLVGAAAVAAAGVAATLLMKPPDGA